MAALYADMPQDVAPMQPPMMTAVPPGAYLPPEVRKPVPEKLRSLMASANIVADISDAKAAEIAAAVVAEYEIDKQSREKLEEVWKAASDLVMLVAEEKNYPFDKASNVKYPLVTTAALQFNARAYSAIVQGNRAAKCITWGADEDGAKAARAERVSEHLSYQLLSQMPEWEEDTDRLTIIVPVDGSAFRKVYRDPAVKRNVTRLVRAQRLVVNYWARSIDDVPRLTEEMDLYPYEIAERIRSGRFIEFDYAALPHGTSEAEDRQGKAGTSTSDNDPAGPHLFLEQQRQIDLDEDGYPEPYIATVHRESGKLCRLVANYDEEGIETTPQGEVAAIRRNCYYVKYTFLPSPDGGFYGLGFGWLLQSTNEAINTTLNQMFDAGHLANMQGGFVSGGLGIRDRTLKFQRGEFKVLPTSLPVNQAIYPLRFDGPNAVLFQLLGLLIEAGKELASVKDVLTGNSPATAPVGTTLAMIQQGLQVFTSIYKRLHRSLRTELGMLAKLNRRYVDPEEYRRFTDDPEADPAVDYGEDTDMDITPLTDPEAVTPMQQIAKAQTVLETARGNPAVNLREATRRFYEAISIGDLDSLLMPEPQPDPRQEAFAAMMMALEKEGKAAEVMETWAKALKAVADAEAAEAGQQLSAYDQFLRLLQAEHGMEMDIAGQGGVGGMEGQPGDGGGLPGLGAAGPGGAGILAGPPAGPPAALPGGMGTGAT